MTTRTMPRTRPIRRASAIGTLDYEEFVAGGDPDFEWSMPDDEWDAISLNYTSGTTGNPKGVVYHHRGAALMAYANTIHAGMGKHAGLSLDAADVPLQRLVLPVDAGRAGRHACLPALGARQGDVRRDRRPWRDASVRRADRHVDADQRQATKTSGSFRRPSPSTPRPRRRREAVLSGMADAGFAVTHLYGLTETYGPAVVNEWHGEWDALDRPKRTARKARQGVRYAALEGLTVMDPATMQRDAGRRRDDRRGDVPRQHRHEGLSEEPQGHRRGLRRRLVPFRRPRRHASGRLHPAQGPLQGHHHLGRRKHLLDRGRGRALQASRRWPPAAWSRGPTRNGARRRSPMSS